MRLALLTAAALVVTPSVALAGKPGHAGPKSLEVVDRQVLVATATDCASVPTAGPPPGDLALRRAAEASPAAVSDGNGVTAVWQQDVEHPAGGSIAAVGATLSTRLGGACGAEPVPGAGTVGPPSTARGADGQVWTAVAEAGTQVHRVLLSDGARTIVVHEQPASPAGNLEVLAPTVAVDPRAPHRVHVAFSVNAFPAGTISTHVEVDTTDGSVSDPHPYWYGSTPALYDFREQLVALGGDELLALSTEVDPAGLPTLAPSYQDRVDLTQAPVVVRARRSSDAGVTWSLPETVLTLANGAVRDPAGGTALRSLAHPSVVTGPDGRIHVAAESVGDASTELLVATSDDGGRSWSTDAAVRRPGVAIATAVAVDGRGRTALSWLDVTTDAAGSVLRGTWRAALTERPDRAVELGASFDLRALAPAYVGDQGALVGLDRGFAAVTVEGTGSAADPTDVVLVRLR